MILPKEYQVRADRFMNGGISEEKEHLTQYTNLSFVTPLGKPGAGKGTIFDEAEKEYHIQKVVTGKLMFSPEETGSFSTQQLEDLSELVNFIVLENNRLLDDNLTLKALTVHVSEQIKKNSFDPDQPIVMDCFPRTLKQLYAVEDLSLTPIFMDVDVSDDTSLYRQKERAKIEKRKDDNKEEKRLREYYRVTAPLVDYVSLQPSKYRVICLDGEQDRECVYSQARGHFSHLGFQEK